MSLIQGLSDYSGAAATWRARNGYMLQTPSSVNFAFVKNGNLPSWATHKTYYQECTSGIQGLHDNQYVNDPALQSYELFPYVMRPTNLRDVLQNALTNPNPIAGSNQRTASLIDPSGTPFNFAAVSTEPAIVYSRLLGRIVDATNPLSIQYSQALYARMDGDHFLLPETKQVSPFARPGKQDTNFFAQQSAQKNLIDYGVVHKDQEMQHVDPQDLRSRYPRASRFIDSKFPGGGGPPPPDQGGNGGQSTKIPSISGMPKTILNAQNNPVTTQNVNTTSVNATGTSNVPNPAFNPNQQTSASQGESYIGLTEASKNIVNSNLVVSERLLNPNAFTPEARKFATTLQDHTQSLQNDISSSTFSSSYSPSTNNLSGTTQRYSFDEHLSNINSPINSERSDFTSRSMLPGVTNKLSLLHSMEEVHGQNSTRFSMASENPDLSNESKLEIIRDVERRNNELRNAIGAYLSFQEINPYEYIPPPIPVAPVENNIADNVLGNQHYDQAAVQAATNKNQSPVDVNPVIPGVTTSATKYIKSISKERISSSFGGSTPISIGSKTSRTASTSQNTELLRRSRNQDSRSVVNGEKRPEDINNRVSSEIVSTNNANYQRDLPQGSPMDISRNSYNPDDTHNMEMSITQSSLFPVAALENAVRNIDFTNEYSAPERTLPKKRSSAEKSSSSMSPPVEREKTRMKDSPSTSDHVMEAVAKYAEIFGANINQTPTSALRQHHEMQMHHSQDTSFPRRVEPRITHEELNAALALFHGELGQINQGNLRSLAVEGTGAGITTADRDILTSTRDSLARPGGRQSRKRANQLAALNAIIKSIDQRNDVGINGG